VVPENGPLQVYGKKDNSSHDALLHECVPVDLHNRYVKIEYTFPNCLTLDAPDKECKEQAIALGVAEIAFGVARITESVASLVMDWLKEHPLKHSIKLLHRAYLFNANLESADLFNANLESANLSEFTILTLKQAIGLKVK
jgi:hypothetical protein